MNETTFDQVKISRAIAKLVETMYEAQVFINIYDKERKELINSDPFEADFNRTELNHRIRRNRVVIQTCQSILDILGVREG